MSRKRDARQLLDPCHKTFHKCIYWSSTARLGACISPPSRVHAEKYGGSQHLPESDVLLDGGVAHVQDRSPHSVGDGGNLEQPLREGVETQKEVNENQKPRNSGHAIRASQRCFMYLYIAVRDK